MLIDYKCISTVYNYKNGDLPEFLVFFSAVLQEILYGDESLKFMMIHL
jgi:hypothetical protein